MVELILQFGGGVNKICIQGWTALHEAVCRNNMQICEMLVEAGAKVGTPNMYGITPLFVAAQGGRVEALRFLIKSGEFQDKLKIPHCHNSLHWPGKLY